MNIASPSPAKDLSIADIAQWLDYWSEKIQYALEDGFGAEALLSKNEATILIDGLRKTAEALRPHA